MNPGAGGAFTCAAAGPGGTILIGSDIAGAYVSTDRGASWTNVGYAAGLQKSYVSAVAFDPQDASIVHLAGEDGLYRSANDAVSFTRVVSGGFWTALAVAPSDPTTVYAAKLTAYNALDPKIFRSTNRGLSWSQVGTLPLGTRVLKLAVKPNDPGRLFALSGYENLMSGSGQPRRALYVSGDSGATWTDAHGDSLSGGMVGNPWDAAYDPGMPDTIYATSVLGSNPDVTSAWLGGAWRGSQAGGTWALLSNHTGAILARPGSPGGPATVTTIDVRRDGPGCAECGSFVTTDGGASWSRASDMTGWDTGWNGSIAWSYNSATAGVSKTLGQDLSDPLSVYWVTPQFAWMSEDAGTSFYRLFTDAIAPGYWKGRGIDNVAPAALSTSGGALFAGFYDLGIWRSLDGGESWQPSNDAVFTGDWTGKGGNCTTILADPMRPEMVWASLGESVVSSTFLIRSVSGGAPGTWFPTQGVPGGYFHGLSLDLESPIGMRTLYVTSNGDVYKSVNDGQSWSLVFDCNECYVTAARGSFVLAGGQAGLWRSLNGGSTWAEIHAPTFHLPPSGYALRYAKWYGPHDILIADPEIYVAMNGGNRGLYKSSDDGGSWTRIVPDDFARTVHRDLHGTLYYGSSSATSSGGDGGAGSAGIWYSTDGGAGWSSLNAGLAWPFVWPIATIRATGTDVNVFVGSPGSGFFRTLLETGAPVAVEPRTSAGLGVGGFRPNPARERVAVAFTLPTGAPATLEVYDLAGRRLVRREVGGMGPGSHVLPLGPDFRPAPGIYVVRLVQGGLSVGARSVVVR